MRVYNSSHLSYFEKNNCSELELVALVAGNFLSRPILKCWSHEEKLDLQEIYERIEILYQGLFRGNILLLDL